MKELGERGYMRNGNHRGLVVEVVAEKIAVEVSSQLPEEIVQRLLRLGFRMQAENIAEVSRAGHADGLQICLADNAAIKEIIGENQPAEQGIKILTLQNVRRRDEAFP